MSERQTTYDSSKVSVTVGGVALDGFAKGSKVKAKRNEDSFSLDVGGDGEGGWSKNNDRSGEVEVRLMYGSKSNPYLSGLLQVDELTGAGTLPVNVRDAKGTSVVFADQARIVRPPEMDWADKATEITWVFKTHSLSMIAGGL